MEILGAIDFIGATSSTIVRSTFLSSLIHHDTIIFGTTNNVTSFVRWVFQPHAKQTPFQVAKSNFEVQKILEESAYDRLKLFICVHYFLL